MIMLSLITKIKPELIAYEAMFATLPPSLVRRIGPSSGIRAGSGIY
jgi:hypothetical protein